MNKKNVLKWLGVTVAGAVVVGFVDWALAELAKHLPDVDWLLFMACGMLALVLGFVLMCGVQIARAFAQWVEDIDVKSAAARADALLRKEHEERIRLAPWLRNPERCPQCASNDIYAGFIFPESVRAHPVLNVPRKYRQVIWDCGACSKRFANVTWFDENGDVDVQIRVENPM